MEKLDNLVAEYIEQRLLEPKRLEQLLSHVLDRRTERAERRKSHIAELRKRAAEADGKLKRLYDAIENGVADLSDPMLKDRIAELKATRDQARLDAERGEDAIERAGPVITPQALKTFARTARKGMRTDGGYRLDHLRALAQRVEVDQKELRIMGSKSVLLRTLVAASSAKTAGFGVPSSVPPDTIRTCDLCLQWKTTYIRRDAGMSSRWRADHDLRPRSPVASDRPVAERTARFGDFQPDPDRVLRGSGAGFSPAAAGAVGACDHCRSYETGTAAASRGGGGHPPARAAASLSALSPFCPL